MLNEIKDFLSSLPSLIFKKQDKDALEKIITKNSELHSHQTQSPEEDLVIQMMIRRTEQQALQHLLRIMEEQDANSEDIQVLSEDIRQPQSKTTDRET
jgi:hypothetical protein